MSAPSELAPFIFWKGDGSTPNSLKRKNCCKKTMNSTTKKTKKLVMAALLLALCWLLPFLTGQLQSLGQMLLPMHLPVMVGGFILGPVWGLAIGFLGPLTRSLIFGMPVMYPMAVGMAFELAAYGFFCGFFHKLFRKTKFLRSYGTLIISMLLGRVVWAIARLVMLGIVKTPFTWQIFLTMEFVNAWPGMLLQLLIVPPLVNALKKARVMD